MDLSRYTDRAPSEPEHRGMIHRLVAVHDVGCPVSACPNLRKFVIGAVRWVRPKLSKEDYATMKRQSREQNPSWRHQKEQQVTKPDRKLYFEQKFLDIELYPEKVTELHRLLEAIGTDSEQLFAMGKNKVLLNPDIMEEFCEQLLHDLQNLVGTHFRIYIQNNRWTDISTVDMNDRRVLAYHVSDAALRNNPISWNSGSRRFLEQAGIDTGLFL